jgi:hypothetical protein
MGGTRVKVDIWTTERYGGFSSMAELGQAVEKLRARGFDAHRDYSGVCRTDAEGHYHANFIKIANVTAKQAARLLK